MAPSMAKGEMAAMSRLSTMWVRVTLQWVVACALALPAAKTHALDRERSLHQLHHTAWRARDGAPSQVWALAQTADGYLWIGAATGLFRFDGVTFERYVPADGTPLPSPYVVSLLATPEGGLWIGFRTGALALLQDDVLQVYTREEQLPPDMVLDFARDHHGTLWAGTNAGLALREGDRWRVVGAAQGFPEGVRARVLGVDRAGTLWASSVEKLLFLPRGERIFRDTGERVNYAVQIAQASDGRHWIAETPRSVRPLALADDAPLAEDDEIRLGSQSIVFDRDGGLWITTLGRGLHRVRHPEAPGAAARVEAFTQADGLTSDQMIVAFEDREGNLWFGTDKGIDRFRHGGVVPVAVPAGYGTFTLMAGDDGEIWAASASATPLLRVRGDALTPQPGVGNILSAHRDGHGVIWWGSYSGIWRQDEDRLTLSDPPGDVRPGDWAPRTLHGDGDGGLWVDIVGHGFVHFRDGRWRGAPADHFPAGAPTTAFNDAQGRVWMGTTPDHLHRIEGRDAYTYPPGTGPRIGRVTVIGGRGPHLWFGGELGLALFRGGRFHPVLAAGSEPIGSISGLVESTSGDLWLNEAQGVVRIPAAEIGRLLADPAHAVQYRRFDFLDGLPGAPQMNRPSFTAVEASDGRLWFATDNGLAWIDPTRLHGNPLPPPVRLRAVDVDGRHLPPGPALQLPVDAHQLRIAYTALSLSIPERVKFRYRLEGVEEDWQDAGTRREAVYTNLGPGQYRFHVLAANEDGVWNEEGATLDFSIPPPFYRTAWFIALCMAVGAGLLWLLYRYRLRVMETRLQARLEERHLERERIARELHDTLLQGIQGLILRVQSAMERFPAHEPARLAMERALERADEVLVEGRDRVQGLRATAVPVDDLAHALAEVGAGLGGDAMPAFRIVVEGKSRALDPLVRDEVFGIAREAIVNAFHHAGARQIDVELCHGEGLRLCIRDDGCGMDPEILAVGFRPGHWGLSGMRERATRIGATLEFRRGAVAGTQVELRVPGRVVRGGPHRTWWRHWLRRFLSGEAGDERIDGSG
ncbi:sensor histidine kinase [Luteimonas kalidii]|uniref:Two-component regulator propeller domain-containing protein n=1 Tax=Luteimonas kalidii TaxID=3042025 RepID=A0ABT6JQ89_9GAMM|nr:sensor histidine kinase [Luteimonas kalidii]MDH5832835.1 two-component regulator propeller domain-containing protein [Luteimonas kalidii]